MTYNSITKINTLNEISKIYSNLHKIFQEKDAISTLLPIVYVKILTIYMQSISIINLIMNRKMFRIKKR
jgi:hypothetical protein